MTETTKPNDAQSAQPMPWQIARDENIRYLKIDQIIQNEKSAEHHRYCEVFLDAANSNETKPAHKPALLMLSAIMSMRIPSDEFESRLLQFEPLGELYDVGRSAISSDFSGEQIETIRKCAKKTQNLVVKTRLEHLVWSLDRKDWRAGQRAIDGYIDTLEAIYSRNLYVRSELDILGATSTRILKVLFSLYRYLDPQNLKELNVKKIIMKFFHKSIESKNIMCILRFGEIAVQIDKFNTAKSIERYINENRFEVSLATADLWKLLANIYLASKNGKKYERCKVREIEVYATMARKYIKENTKSANEISNTIKRALKACHGIPGVQRKYINLRKMLVDVKKKIPAEMVHIRNSVDVKEFAHSVIDEFRDLDLSEALIKLKDKNISLDSDETKEEAIKLVMQFPLQYSFYSEMTDDSGKTIAISKGVTVSENKEVKGSLDPAIMHGEEYRRGYYETGFIGAARVEISRNHRVSREKILNILRFSPIVPPQYRHTLSVGFEHYFNQDWTASAYILIPMLEGILRQGLLWGGYDIRDLGETENDQGRLISLSKILSTKSTELASVFNRKVVEDMYRLFCTKWGPSVRHHVVHALHSGNLQYARDASYACWLIWKVATLDLFLRNK